MSKICLHIQTLSMIDKDVYASSLAWAFYLGRHTDHEFMLSTPTRSSIDRGRNEAAKAALFHDCDYLLFMDDDMVIHPQTFDSLIKCQADIAMAHSYIRGYPYQPMCFTWKDDGSGPHNPQGSSLDMFPGGETLAGKWDENGILEVAAVGFTCALIDTKLLKELEPPYFITSPNQTEDVHFCLRAQFEIPRKLKIVVDGKFPTTHLGEKAQINVNTIGALREVEKSMEVSRGRKDRDASYHEMVEGL